MQLEAIKIFCDVVRWSSFSRGAAENGVSQSSASHAVSELEKRLGVRLIDRSKRPLVLTAPGKVYYEGCREVVARYFEIENRVRAFEDSANVGGKVHVAAIYSVGLHHLRSYVDRFETIHPGAEVRLEFMHPTKVVEAVRDGSAELGLISFPRKWPEFVITPWRSEEMVLAVHPGHPLASRETVELPELDGLRIVGFDPGLAIRREVDRFLRRHQAQVETGPEFDNIENIKRAVEALPNGAAILPEPTLARERAAETLRVLRFRGASMTRPLAILHRRGNELGLTAKSFLQLLTGDDGCRCVEKPPSESSLLFPANKRKDKTRPVGAGGSL